MVDFERVHSSRPVEISFQLSFEVTQFLCRSMSCLWNSYEPFPFRFWYHCIKLYRRERLTFRLVKRHAVKAARCRHNNPNIGLLTRPGRRHRTCLLLNSTPRRIIIIGWSIERPEELTGTLISYVRQRLRWNSADVVGYREIVKIIEYGQPVNGKIGMSSLKLERNEIIRRSTWRLWQSRWLGRRSCDFIR